MKNERKFLSKTTFEDVINGLNSSSSNASRGAFGSKIPNSTSGKSGASGIKDAEEQSVISRMRVNRSSND